MRAIIVVPNAMLLDVFLGSIPQLYHCLRFVDRQFITEAH